MISGCDLEEPHNLLGFGFVMVEEGAREDGGRGLPCMDKEEEVGGLQSWTEGTFLTPALMV